MRRDGSQGDISEFIAKIMEEFYDPDISLLSAEELEEIIEKYSKESEEEEDIVMKEIIEEYYDPNMTPLSEEEFEEILVRFGDETLSVNLCDYKDIFAEKETTANEKSMRRRKRKRSIRRGGRGKRKSNDLVDIKLLHMNCDGYTYKKQMYFF